LGFVSLLSVEQKGVLSLLSLIPHGIFEFPAIYLNGIRLKTRINLFYKGYSKELKKKLRILFKFFYSLYFLLLILAGIIEGVLIKII